MKSKKQIVVETIDGSRYFAYEDISSLYFFVKKYINKRAASAVYNYFKFADVGEDMTMNVRKSGEYFDWIFIHVIEKEEINDCIK